MDVVYQFANEYGLLLVVLACVCSFIFSVYVHYNTRDAQKRIEGHRAAILDLHSRVEQLEARELRRAKFAVPQDDSDPLPFLEVESVSTD